MRKGLSVFFAIGLSTASAWSGEPSAARLAVEDFRELLVKAIDSSDGAARGMLVGPMADALSSRMKSTAPILVDVTTLRRYRQPGCSRLNVRFSQDGVVLPGEREPRKETLDLGMNYCKDGLPPRSLD
jgi:hypothetical protein